MKVLLIDPPFYEEVALGKGHGSSMHLVQNVIPSLGLGYLAAVLEKNEFPVDIIDCQALKLTQEDFKNEIHILFGVGRHVARSDQ